MEARPTTPSELSTETAVESIKIEKNSKGTSFAVRIGRQPGQTWDDVLRELRRVEGELRREYGGQ